MSDSLSLSGAVTPTSVPPPTFFNSPDEPIPIQTVSPIPTAPAPVVTDTPAASGSAFFNTPDNPIPVQAPVAPTDTAVAPAAPPQPGFFNSPDSAIPITAQDQPVQPPVVPVLAQDQAVQPLTAAPPQESGFFSGLTSGATAAFHEGVQTLQGQAFTTDPNAQPEPTRGWFNELGYGIGHSFPVIGAGVGGGAAGAAVGGPVGGAIGAALGVGGMSLVQDLAPTYAAAVHGGMSHDDAVDYALKHAAATGAISGATAPLFGLAPLKSALGKILFQSVVTQPVAGAAVRAGVPAVLGEPLPSAEEMVKGLG